MSQEQAPLPQRIGIYGTGRMATALLRGLHEAGFEELHLLGRDPRKLDQLSEIWDAPCSLPENVHSSLDLVLVAVKDDAIPEAIHRLPAIEGLLAHCSGSLPWSILGSKGKGQGVFWPIQSFSWEEMPDWDKIPIGVEGSDPLTENLLQKVAEQLSDTVRVLRGPDRSYLHLAAVFACNFTNHFYGIAQEILKEHELPYQLLSSLILHTAKKGVENDPHSVQTGPSARGDRRTMEEHLELIDDPELKDLYERIGRRIMKEQHGTSEL